MDDGHIGVYDPLINVNLGIESKPKLTFISVNIS